MKKLFYLIIVMLVLGLLLPAAAVADETQSPSASTSEGMMFAATVMPLDGSWVILDEIMTAPAFFLIGSPWTWDSDFPVKFTITDLYVVTDRFEVYDGGSFVIETPNIPDWDVLGLGGPFVSPPYTVDPDIALAEVRFSSEVICFASGSHSITIKDIHIPPTLAGPAFPDGTVAFKAELIAPTVTTSLSGPDPAYVGEVAIWDITITICPDDVEDIYGVVVQGGIGADLAITEVNDIAVGYPMDKKTEQTVGDVTLIKKGGKMGATIVKWDIGTLLSNGCLDLVLTVETGLNPKDKQEFTSAEEGHELDGGFSATYWYCGMEYETPETEPLTVDVVE